MNLSMPVYEILSLTALVSKGLENLPEPLLLTYTKYES